MDCWRDGLGLRGAHKGRPREGIWPTLNQPTHQIFLLAKVSLPPTDNLPMAKSDKKSEKKSAPASKVKGDKKAAAAAKVPSSTKEILEKAKAVSFNASFLLSVT